MKFATAFLVLFIPLALGCPKNPDGPTPPTPPAEGKPPHAATPVETPPPGGPATGGPAAPTGTPTGATGAAPTTPPPAQGGNQAREACVDKHLADRKLNEYGDAEGTMYAGGSPLFDERTGTRTERLDYVFAKHPDIKKACAP